VLVQLVLLAQLVLILFLAPLHQRGEAVVVVVVQLPQRLVALVVVLELLAH
jgi:hypothetical protein